MESLRSPAAATTTTRSICKTTTTTTSCAVATRTEDNDSGDAPAELLQESYHDEEADDEEESDTEQLDDADDNEVRINERAAHWIRVADGFLAHGQAESSLSLLLRVVEELGDVLHERTKRELHQKIVAQAHRLRLFPRTERES